MNNQEKLQSALTKQSPAPMPIEMLLSKCAKELGKALPSHMSPERLTRLATTCMRQNNDLYACDQMSFIGAVFTAAGLGIEPLHGQSYILPFNNRRKVGGQWISVKEAQFILGYRGMVTLFYRHEKSKQLNWGVVKANDEFDYEYGTSAFIKHRPSKKARGEVIGYWVLAELEGGGKPFVYMSSEECMEHGMKHSKTFDKEKNIFHSSSPWSTSPESMCLKTCFIQLTKLLPLSFEMQKAIHADETSRAYESGVSDIFEIKPTTDWSSEEAITTHVEGDKK